MKMRLLKYAEYAATLVLVGFAAYGGVEYLLGVQPYRVVTDSPSSMSNAINYGDVVAVYGAPYSSLRVGDVIVFHDPRGNPGVVIHRIFSVGDCQGQVCYTTKGDNMATNPSADPWSVTESFYEGRVLAVLPYAGYLSPALWGFTGVSLYVLLGSIGGIAVLLGIKSKNSGKETSKASGGASAMDTAGGR
ncbi:MAG: signal peptidase I [archaeon]|nr:MAG: signal peptidase I [archaeon]